MIRPGSAVALTAGTTTWRLALRLADVADLTVITNSMRIADVLLRADRPDLTVVLTGGVRTPSDALVGPVAVEAMRSLHADIVFMGVHGMNESAGFTTPNLLEAEANRALIGSARRLVVVADHTKWGIVGLSSIAPLEAAATIVSDRGLSRDARGRLAEHVEEIVIAR